MQEPIALIATAPTSSPEYRPDRSRRVIVTTSPHQIVWASCSAQPGRGNDISCSTVELASTTPAGVTSTPFDEYEPISIPRRSLAIVCSRCPYQICRPSIGTEPAD